MKMTLLRHGLAVSRDDFISVGKDDSFRPLVAKGRERTKLMAKYFKKWGMSFDLIVSSPYLRCQQTAEICSDILKISNLFESSELVPQAPPMAFAQWLRVHADECLSVLVIGHEPQLSAFATWCLSGQKESFIDLKKSGVVVLEIKSFADFHPGAAMLDLVIQPKFLEN
jgi:phosphohistidine phosphatase